MEMTKKEIIEGLRFTIDMFLFDPDTGETYTEPRNDKDKTTIDACKGAIELLEEKPYKLTKFEFDLIKCYRTIDYALKDCWTLEKMQDKGYFKDVPDDAQITDIIDNCEVIDNED